MNHQKSLNVLGNGYEGRRPVNYEGRVPDRYSRGFNYDGENEEASFADEAQLSRELIFAFTVTNSNNAAIVTEYDVDYRIPGTQKAGVDTSYSSGTSGKPFTKDRNFFSKKRLLYIKKRVL